MVIDVPRDQPRPHHYEFAHRALPSIAGRATVDLRALAESGRLNDALQATWAAVAERHPESERIDGAGLTAELVTVADVDALVVTFPPASRVAEACFALICPLAPAESRRYVTLELSRNPLTGEAGTVLGEWGSGGHINYGDGPPAERSAFISRAAEIVA